VYPHHPGIPLGMHLSHPGIPLGMHLSHPGYTLGGTSHTPWVYPRKYLSHTRVYLRCYTLYMPPIHPLVGGICLPMPLIHPFHCWSVVLPCCTGTHMGERRGGMRRREVSFSPSFSRFTVGQESRPPSSPRFTVGLEASLGGYSSLVCPKR